jgi:hypothetical protein
MRYIRRTVFLFFNEDSSEILPLLFFSFRLPL